MTDDETTVEIDAEALAQFVTFSAIEYDEIDFHVPEGVSDDEVWDQITARNVDYVDSYGDEVEVGGSFIVREVVGRIPAGGGPRGEPPVNPPEVLTNDRDAHFVLRFVFEDLGYATGSIEVV